MCRRLAVLWLLAASTCVQAQWSTTSLDSAVNSSAKVHNDSGAYLQIFLTSGNQLVGEFKLGPGLLSLDPVTCPTLQIDQNLPEDFNLAKHQCAIRGDLARFLLTVIGEHQVDSKTFLELMNGNRLVIRYRLQGAGYGQQEFSLKGSKQVLKATLPHETVVIGD